MARTSKSKPLVRVVVDPAEAQRVMVAAVESIAEPTASRIRLEPRSRFKSEPVELVERRAVRAQTARTLSITPPRLSVLVERRDSIPETWVALRAQAAREHLPILTVAQAVQMARQDQ